jgi:hypothetical protein
MIDSTSAKRATALTGNIACVGLGMTLGSHLSPLARSHIEQADIVFAALSDGIVEMWLERMHPDVCSRRPLHRGPTAPSGDDWQPWIKRSKSIRNLYRGSRHKFAARADLSNRSSIVRGFESK